MITLDNLANQIYCDRYNDVYPDYVRMEWRRRDLLSCFHPYSLMDKAAAAVYRPGRQAPSASLVMIFVVGVVIGFLVRRLNIFSALVFLGIQLFFLFVWKQPDRSTGEPLVTDIFNFIKIAGMWIGWLIASKL